jgi:TonB family protein
VQGRPVFARVEQPITWRVDSAAIAAAAAAGERPQGLREGEYELSQVEVLPRLLNASEFQRAMARHHPDIPDHPPEAVAVRVRFLVREDGSVREPSVLHSPDPRFDEATLRVTRVLRFTPALLNGRAVKVWVEQPIHWMPRQ